MSYLCWPGEFTQNKETNSNDHGLLYFPFRCFRATIFFIPVFHVAQRCYTPRFAAGFPAHCGNFRGKTALRKRKEAVSSFGPSGTHTAERRSRSRGCPPSLQGSVHRLNLAVDMGVWQLRRSGLQSEIPTLVRPFISSSTVTLCCILTAELFQST